MGTRRSWCTSVLSAAIYLIMLITVITVAFCIAQDSIDQLSSADQAEAASGEEEGDKSVKSDIRSPGGFTRVNITLKSQLSKSHSGVGHSINHRQLKPY